MSDMTPDDDALIRQARLGMEPTDEDHARVKRKVLGQLGLGVGAATSVLSASTTAGARMVTASVLANVAKIVGGVIVVVGAGAAIAREWPSASVPSSVARSGSVVAPLAASVAPTPAAVRELAWSAPAAASDAPAPPMAPTGSPTATASPGRAAPPAAPSGDGSRESVPPVSASAMAHIAETATPASPSLGEAATAASEPGQGSPAGPATVAAEARLLRDADAALRAGDAARALSLLDQHASLFPGGVLVEERDAERVVVLCALGQVAAAREAGSAFIRDHARSPLVARVRGSCAGP
jgi:hypothetical protein